MYELTIKFDSIEELRAYLDGVTPAAQEEIAPTQTKAERTRTAPKAEPEPEAEKPKATRKSKKAEPEQEEEDISYARLQAAVRKLIADGKSPKLKEILKQREWSSFKFLESEGSEDELRWAITKVEAEL